MSASLTHGSGEPIVELMSLSGGHYTHLDRIYKIVLVAHDSTGGIEVQPRCTNYAVPSFPAGLHR